MAVLLILLVDSLLFLAAGSFAFHGNVAVCLSILMATVPLILWQWLLLNRLKVTDQTIRIENGIRQPHYVQALLHLLIYSYWGLYWDEVARYAPLMIVQIIFVYAFEMLLSWSKYRVWRIGFGPLPVVFSISFFMWFTETFFIFQLGLLMLTYIGKEFIHWNRDGRNTHIFNPSGFSLAVVSLLLLMTGTATETDLTRAVDIVGSFELPPNFFEVLFLLSLVVQFLFGTALVTLGAMLTLTLLYQLLTAVFGAPYADIPICASVFLGLTFLVTDPSTSPKTNVGKFLFGATYGGGVLLVAFILRMTHQPTFADKILLVPVVNLLAPFFDRIGGAVHRWVERTQWIPAFVGARYAHVLLCIFTFAGVLPLLKNPYRGALPEFLPESVSYLSPSVSRLVRNKQYCRLALPEPYRPFGFRSEITSYRKIRFIYQHGQHDDAIADFSKAIRRNPVEHVAYRYRGVAYGRQGELDKAIADFTEAIRLNPQAAATYSDRAVAYLRKGELDKSIKDATEAIRLNPDLAEAYYNRGLVYLRKGDQANADADFAKAEKIGFNPAE